MFWCWLLFCGFCAMVLEIIVGNWGYYIPVLATLAFYFTVVAGWRPVFPLFAVLGSVLDLSVGRSVPLQFPVLSLAIFLGTVWRRHGDCSHAGAQGFPGGVLGALAGGIGLLYARPPGFRLSLSAMIHDLPIVACAAIGGCLLVPLYCLVLDRCAAKLDFRCFQRAQQDDTARGP